jgi:DNA polymerase elongation subunit (family B)
MDIKGLVKGMTVEENFAVISTTAKKTAGGKPYLVVELSHPTGTINAKVWDDNMPMAIFEPGKVFRVWAIVDAFRDAINLNVNKAFLVEEEKVEDYVKSQPTLVFDIETSGKKFEELDEWDQNYLLNNLQKYEEDKEEAKKKTALYPLYGQVVSIGMFNPESKKGNVFLISKKKTIKLDDNNFKAQTFVNEKEMLGKFWQVFAKFKRYVTYNGIRFDLPFLQFRSAINQVKVPLELKFYSDEHVDLMKKFSTGNVYKLEALCRAFKITNPKEKGVSGMHVSNLFEKGKVEEIANYVARDAISTSQLYEIWKKYMAGKIVV